MSGEILFIAHRLPFPPDRGDKIRSHHILKHLASLAPVHVATFADDEADFAEEASLASMAASYCLRRRTKPLPLAALQALATGRPVSLTAFHDRALADYVAEVLATRPIVAIYVFSGQMGQYVPVDFTGRLIVDLVDVDSAKFEAYAAKRSGPMALVEAREARRLAAEEARLAARADVTLLISSAETELFRSRLPVASPAEVRVLGNGIDSVGFDPALVSPEPKMTACAGPRLIFTGQMDYAPNIDAALRVIDRVLPRIRAVRPDTSFHVVGRNPTSELLARHGRDGCHVWGRVEDIRPWLAAADCALIPLEIGRGVQNKVLEAMSMALPVVLSNEAATGIAAQNGEHFAVVDNDAALAEAVLAMLDDPARARAMGAAARRFVVENASWEAALAPLAEFVGGPGRVRHAA
ncbi:TIGR03087 family PEP-CTERM/XrtA system glycosyltransferase [Novosphingobium sp. JCM 18896]|uniref:TIGR03087 family PEP-CTERM/XrtA system glycosyltransferase n=1 Tax=Novosphingobium sp. JCM 18896 TaxID=2989731 RepID=UPI002223D6C0|nr:TIGR03087 family PEP-CTERM/XrtA system glycosyltransferase [Novosphingobium sp. JCM 18896]MCW1428154.1 TIGR03087 family PEP-CTERM/XrtA system glycosyltransferase [Novosphingobium sp. JCM 18896]